MCVCVYVFVYALVCITSSFVIDIVYRPMWFVTSSRHRSGFRGLWLYVYTEYERNLCSSFCCSFIHLFAFVVRLYDGCLCFREHYHNKKVFFFLLKAHLNCLISMRVRFFALSRDNNLCIYLNLSSSSEWLQLCIRHEWGGMSFFSKAIRLNDTIFRNFVELLHNLLLFSSTTKWMFRCSRSTY